MKKLLLLLIPLMLVACKQVDYTQVVTYHSPKGTDVAAVKIVEWGDFQCPACGQSYQILKPVFEKYQDKIQVDFKHFPLTSIHPFAFNAAVASECAADQSMFWQYHDKLYENQQDLKKSDLIAYAGQLNMDVTKFEACYDSRVKADIVKSDMAEADKLGLNSTPTFFFDGEKLQDWSVLPQLLASKFPETATTTTK